MLTTRQIEDRLQDRNLKAVASETNVSYRTLGKLKHRKLKHPLHADIKALSEYFQRCEQ